MQRSSELIGAIAAALAKAQGELINPEKSLTAIIRSPFPREADRTFRYASLSAGLEIVRKALGKHEIATVQTTAIDPEAGLIRLTTVLAHSSGEWISSDWPVCPVGETAAPHKMGAALTYARRYSLFTLVGIAGEDDLDAPDLPTLHSDEGSSSLGHGEKMNGDARAAAVAAGGRKNIGRRKFTRDLDRTELPPDQSASVRERLLGEIAVMQSTESATRWAQDGIITKNSLAATDARLVEEAFAVKLSELSDAGPGEAVSVAICAETHATPPELAGTAVQTSDRSLVITRVCSRSLSRGAIAIKSICGLSPDKRVSCAGENRQTPIICGLCNRVHSARRFSDEFVAPLCRIHHRGGSSCPR